MPLGMEVGLAHAPSCSMGTQLPPTEKGGTALHPIFGPCLLWPNGWMDEDATTEVDLSSGHIVLDGDPAPP